MRSFIKPLSGLFIFYGFILIPITRQQLNNVKPQQKNITLSYISQSITWE